MDETTDFLNDPMEEPELHFLSEGDFFNYSEREDVYEFTDTSTFPTEELTLNAVEDFTNNVNETAHQKRRKRASGDILELLVAEFNVNSNPGTEKRKELAAKTGMTERSVRIWFQNRRAKTRKLGKANGQDESRPVFSRGNTISDFRSQSAQPEIINGAYCLIECGSISIGSWQRIKSGFLNNSLLSNLSNLSPKFLFNLMFTTDLLVILSKKNDEINYFFSGYFDNSKILFRIFYPMSSISSCALINNQVRSDDETSYESELSINLIAPPKFAVFFSHDKVTQQENPNQWLICDDFSEDQQVFFAHNGEGGHKVPHLLHGDLTYLKFLNNSILQYHNQQREEHSIMEFDLDVLPREDPLIGSISSPEQD